MPDKRHLAIYGTVFLDLFGFGLIIPLLPYYAVKVGASGLELGVLLASFSIAQFFGSPLLGRWSDRYGRRRVLLLSLSGAAVAFLATGLATTFTGLVAARSFAGFFSATISTAQAYVADTAAPEKRTQAMGLVGAALGMGFVLGPAAGAALSKWGFETANFVAAAMAAANFAFTWAVLPEPARSGERRRGGFIASLRHIAGTPALRIIVVNFLFTAAFVSMESTLALLAARRFGWGASQLGMFFTFVGVVMVVMQARPVALIGARIGEKRAALAGMVLTAAGIAVMPVVPWLHAGGLLLAAGQALVMATVPSIVSCMAEGGETGLYLGALQGMGSAARCVGPIVAGALFDYGYAYPYVWGTALLLIAIVLFASVKYASGLLPQTSNLKPQT